MNLWPERKREVAPLQIEIAGWVGFLLYVALVYRIRQALNRPRPDT
jgi:hypothetical protein